MLVAFTMDSVVPAGHPLRRILGWVNAALEEASPKLEAVYAERGRPSIAPERLIKALLLQALYGIGSERKLVEWIGHDLLFRWFLGMRLEEAVWDASTFSKNRDRLLTSEAAGELLRATVEQARGAGLLGGDEFRVDGTLIASWASRRSVAARREPPEEGDGSGRRGQVLANDRYVSGSDPEARLYRKGGQTLLCHMGHLLSDGRHGLVVGARLTAPSPRAERAAALEMLREHRGVAGAAVAADRGYDEPPFVRALEQLGLQPHVARYRGQRRSSVPDAVAQTEAYRRSQRRRRRIEQIFSWIKAEGRLRRARHRGRARVGWSFILAAAAYNLVRMAALAAPLA